MPDMLDRIDNVLAGGICPCGADPVPGSAYCGDDCTPTHRSVHTTSDTDGTQMRWRPDLVTAVDDSGLELIAAFQRGQHNAQVFGLGDRDGLHCRLDDGYRFVGCDVDGPAADRCLTDSGDLEPVWERLERELGNSRHLDPDSDGSDSGDPWADVMGRWSRAADAVFFGAAPGSNHLPVGWSRQCVHCGERAIPQPGRRCRPTPYFLDIPPTLTSDQGLEDCDLCRNCGRQFPGPRLTAISEHLDTGIQVRAQLRDHRGVCQVVRLFTARSPTGWELDEMESALLDAYARDHPDRPDVIDWQQARTERQTRQVAAWAQWRVADRYAAQVADPYSLLRGISMA